ncbi:MAG: hypothetical protein ACK5MP_10595 [Nostocoides sp.]
MPPSDRVQQRVLRSLDGITGETVGFSCGAVDRSVPTMGQIEQAFKELPFAMPSVHVQPEGNETLVNLPTYYEVRWPSSGLSAGDVSAPVQLLSWSVRFKIAAHSHTYRFGDGQSSGPTTDVGGPYPRREITHMYAHKGTVKVKVDAVLTGQVSINGGPWEPLAATAELPDEPVTVLAVKEVRNHLIPD